MRDFPWARHQIPLIFFICRHRLAIYIGFRLIAAHHMCRSSLRRDTPPLKCIPFRAFRYMRSFDEQCSAFIWRCFKDAGVSAIFSSSYFITNVSDDDYFRYYFDVDDVIAKADRLFSPSPRQMSHAFLAHHEGWYALSSVRIWYLASFICCRIAGDDISRACYLFSAIFPRMAMPLLYYFAETYWMRHINARGGSSVTRY